MTVSTVSNNPIQHDRKRRIDTIRAKMRSQRSSDVFTAMIDVRKLLNENIEDQEIYELLLDAVENNHELRQEVRGLLIDMIKRGSKSAEIASHNLPTDVKGLLADADDVYYVADYEQAVKLYREVLEKEPTNIRAKEQLAKSELILMAGMPDSDLPRAAIRYFRQARSHIAARDFVAATDLLNAALEAAKVKGMEFPEAENLLNGLQDLWTADEYKAKGESALKGEQWGAAWDCFKKALLLNPDDQATKELLNGLDGLMHADAILDSLSNPEIAENERKDKLDKVESILKVAEEIKPLVNTALLKNCRSRYKQYQDKGVRGWLSSRRLQMTIVTLLSITMLGILAMSIKEWFGENDPPTSTMTFSPVLATNTNPSVQVEATTPAPAMSSTATVTFTPSVTFTPTVTATETPSPTAAPLGYGRVINFVFPVETPNGKRITHSLKPDQLVILWEQKIDLGISWYRCTWVENGIDYTGWVLASSIQVVPAPTPTP